MKFEIEFEYKVISKIIEIDGVSGLLDSDLAELYGVETSEVNRAVQRNSKRLVAGIFYTKLTNAQKKELIDSDSERFKKLKFSPTNPNFFNKYGIVMLSTILNSDTAIEVCKIVVTSFVDNKSISDVAGIIEQVKTQQEQIYAIATEVQKISSILQKSEDNSQRSAIGFGTDWIK